ncbi:hypothetical protein J6590_073557 [Homalodisca vitripennis]|nr:hypothetical protein J6590_073557 [Homalodisca vitripennis]
MKALGCKCICQVTDIDLRKSIIVALSVVEAPLESRYSTHVAVKEYTRGDWACLYMASVNSLWLDMTCGWNRITCNTAEVI